MPSKAVAAYVMGLIDAADGNPGAQFEISWRIVTD
jgi:hypothetical protein